MGVSFLAVLCSASQENNNVCTEQRGFNDRQRNGETRPNGNGQGGNNQRVDAWEQAEAAPINTGAAAGSFKILRSKYTGGVTDQP